MVGGLKWRAHGPVVTLRYRAKKDRAGQGQKQGKVLDA